MLSALHEFGAALRSAGLAIATPQIADAATALTHIDLGDREAFRSALRATLLARHRDAAIFDAVFEWMFQTQADDGASASAALISLLGQQRATALRAELVEISPLAAALAGARPGDLDSMAAAAGAELSAGPAQTTLQSGAVAYRMGAAMNLEALEEAVRTLIARRLGGDEAAAVGDIFSRRLAGIRAALRERATSLISLRAPQKRRELALSHLETTSLASLSPAELSALSVEVDRLARALLAARKRRHPRATRGRLDASATLRRSLATDGVPIEPRLVHRRPRRPRLVVLCDVSDSVRNVSRFMLQLVYTIAKMTSGVKAYAFVSELGEVTSLFRQHKVERAMELIASGDVVNVFANSNYGKAFGQFAAHHLGAVFARTTVIIIGDGRTNYHDPGLAALATIRRRAHRLLWLNPEPRSIWGFGDSAMNEYSRFCDDVAVVGNLASLRDVIDGLV